MLFSPAHRGKTNLPFSYRANFQENIHCIQYLFSTILNSLQPGSFVPLTLLESILLAFEKFSVACFRDQ